MALQLQNTANISQGPVKCLVYGKAKMGKTTLCSTAPNPVILSCEKGLLSLRKFQLAYAEIGSFNEMVKAVEELVNGKNQFETICIDSISEIAQIEIDRIKPTYKDKRQAYNEIFDTVNQFMRQLQTIPNKNMLILAQLDQFQDETGMQMFGPRFPGKALNGVAPYKFDETFFLHKATFDGKEYRVLRTQPTNTIDAGDRSGALDELEPANISHIFAKIRKV